MLNTLKTLLLFSPLVLLLLFIPNVTGQSIPTTDINGRTLTFQYTDDNRDEDLIVRTTAETYHGFSTASIFTSVTNISPDSQFVDLQVYFNRPDESVSQTFVLVKDVPFQIDVNDFAQVDHVCRDPWTPSTEEHLQFETHIVYECVPTGESFPCDEIRGDTCTVNRELVGTHKETRFEDRWIIIQKTNPRDTKLQRELLSKTIRSDYTAREKATDIIAAGQTKFYKIDIEFPPHTRNEFYIEAVGSLTAYGLLDPWYDSDWILRKQITINGSEILENLTNFPILLNFTDTDLRDDAQADGDDIVFTDTDETTQLSHEIEQYDASDGWLTAWVRVNLTASTDKTLFMYYNNTNATNQQDTTGGTWREEYRGVFHFMEGDRGHDSSQNGVDPTTIQSQCVEQDGNIAKNNNWTRKSCNFNFDDTTAGEINFDNNDEVTVSAWTDTDRDQTINRHFATKYDTGGSNSWALGTNNQEKPTFWIIEDSSAQNVATDTFVDWLDDSVMHYQVGRGNGSHALIKTDDNPTVVGAAYSGIFYNSATELRIGGYGNGGADSAVDDGLIDELRIYNGTLTDNWIDTEYCNQQVPTSFINASNTNCEFWYIGLEETEFVSPVPTAPTGLTAIATSPNNIDLNWTHNLNNGTNGFTIFRETPVGNGFITLVANTTTTTTSFSNSGLLCNTQYNYMVAALNANGTSPNSNEASDFTFACPVNALYLRVAPHVYTWHLNQQVGANMVNQEYWAFGKNTDHITCENRKNIVIRNMTVETIGIAFNNLTEADDSGIWELWRGCDLISGDGVELLHQMNINNVSGFHGVPLINGSLNIELNEGDTFNFKWNFNGSTNPANRGFAMIGHWR